MLSSSDLILEMKDISKEFPGVKALDGVSLRVHRGEIHAICGENGAGKSTLMKVLSGVYPHGTYSGEIVYDGKLASFANIRGSEHAGIVIIHQELALIPELSITENIFLGNEVRGRLGIDWVQARQKAKELMARVGLQDDPDTRIKSIGVGKQQLVEIAKARQQGREAADPRRADGGAQRDRLRPPARPDPWSQGPRHHLAS